MDSSDSEQNSSAHSAMDGSYVEHPPSCDELNDFALPAELTRYRDELGAFLKGVGAAERLVLVTCGGTKTPLERNCVRFIDNFSSGRRGALSTEEFLHAGYAVVFLHRRGCVFPFMNALVPSHAEETFMGSLSVGSDGAVSFAAGERQAAALRSYQDYKKRGRFFAFAFQTLDTYLHLLRQTCVLLRPLQARALVYLSAAVSDFFVPLSELPQHKMSSPTAIRLHLSAVPKLLPDLKRTWCPRAFVISFKLETDPDVLMQKTNAALESAEHDAAIANLLHNRELEVKLVTRQGAVTHIDATSAAAAGGQSTGGGGEEFRVERAIVDQLSVLHGEFISANAGKK